MKTTKSCHKDPVFKQLSVGDRVVVKCDLEAFVAHEEKEENNELANDVDTAPVNVNKNTENETIDDHKTSKVTAVKTKSKYRCRGEGSTGRNTRFSALALPTCHGKWMRLTVGQPKQCSYQESQFIFV